MSETPVPETPTDGDAHARVVRMVFGASVAQIIRCAALFSLADHVARGRTTAAAIAAAEGLHADATERLMRACAAFGLLTAADSEGRYGPTDLLDVLRSDAPHSLRDLALIQGGPGHWGPWGRLDDAIRTGSTQARATLGADLWDYYESEAGRIEGRAVAGAMGGASRDIDAAARVALDTGDAGVAVDVGGAGGSLLRAVMAANPALRGILFDLPLVIEQVRSLPDNAGLADRLQLVPGSFFHSVPTADLYLLRHILHDWGDAECTLILRNCRRSARPGARLVIIELTLDGEGARAFAAQVDLTMMVAVGGRERRIAEYDGLLRDAGFALRSATPLTPTHSLIEAVAV